MARTESPRRTTTSGFPKAWAANSSPSGSSASGMPWARSGPVNSEGPLMGSVRCPSIDGSGPDGLGVAFLRLVAALVVGVGGPPDLRVGHDALPPQAAEILEPLPAAARVLLQELRHALQEALDDVGPHRVVEHRRRANLD